MRDDRKSQAVLGQNAASCDDTADSQNLPLQYVGRRNSVCPHVARRNDRVAVCRITHAPLDFHQVAALVTDFDNQRRERATLHSAETARREIHGGKDATRPEHHANIWPTCAPRALPELAFKLLDLGLE